MKTRSVLILCLCFLLIGCGRQENKEGVIAKKEPPETEEQAKTRIAETFTAAKEAGAKDDRAELYRHYSKATLRRIAAPLVQTVVLATLEKSPAKFIDPAWKSLEKHGILRKDLEEALRRPPKERVNQLDAVTDFRALILDLEPLLPGAAAKRTPHPFYYDDIKEITVEGGLAHARVHFKGREEEAPEGLAWRPMYFVRQGGTWKIDLHAEEAAVKSWIEERRKAK